MITQREQKIREFVQAGCCKKEPIGSDQDILLSGLLDSLSIANLLVFLESEFDLKIPLEDVTVENFSTTNDIANFVSERLENQ